MNTEPIFRIMRYAKAGKLNDALKTCRTREPLRYFMTAADWMFYSSNEKRTNAATIWAALDEDRIHDTTETGGKMPAYTVELELTADALSLIEGPYYSVHDVSGIVPAVCVSRAGVSPDGVESVISALGENGEGLKKIVQRRPGVVPLTITDRREGRNIDLVIACYIPAGSSSDEYGTMLHIHGLMEKCQDEFLRGYIRAGAEHPDILKAEPTFFLMAGRPWEHLSFNKDARDAVPWLNMPEDFRFPEAWRAAGREWFRHEFEGRRLIHEG